MPDTPTPGQVAYAAYGATTNHLNYQGLPMPAWDALGDTVRQAWENAAAETVRGVQGWMALDIHVALGKPTDYAADARNQGHKSWGDWWAQLVNDVRPPEPPRRGDAVEAWLKACRDDHSQAHDTEWDVIDQLLDLYRLHADTGTPLGEHVCEGGNVDDCAGCYGATLLSPAELQARLAAAHTEVARRKGTDDA